MRGEIVSFWRWALGVFILDQASKLGMTWLLNRLPDGVINAGIFRLHLVYNQGAAFGILKGHQEVFVAVAVITVAAAVSYLYYLKPDYYMQIIVGMIAGGAAGNLLDRLIYGYVVDFIDFGWWPVFNLADSAIVIGACWLGLSILRPEKNRDEWGEKRS